MGSGDEDRREPLRGQRRNIRRPTRSGGGWTSRPGKAGRNFRQCSRTNQQNRARNSIIGTQNRQSNSKPNTVQQIGAQSRPRATAEPRTEIHSDSPTRQQRSATTRRDAQVLIEGGVEERVEHAVGVAEHRDDVHPGQRPPRRPRHHQRQRHLPDTTRQLLRMSRVPNVNLLPINTTRNVLKR